MTDLLRAHPLPQLRADALRTLEARNVWKQKQCCSGCIIAMAATALLIALP